jgi:hypothetical protein
MDQRWISHGPGQNLRIDRRIHNQVASVQDPPVGKAEPPVQRIGELVGQRSATRTVFQLSGGRLQQEVSTTPVHYRAADDSWQPIDTTLPSAGTRVRETSGRIRV